MVLSKRLIFTRNILVDRNLYLVIFLLAGVSRCLALLKQRIIGERLTKAIADSLDSYRTDMLGNILILKSKGDMYLQFELL